MRAAFLLLLAMLAFPTLVQAAGEISAVGTSRKCNPRRGATAASGKTDIERVLSDWCCC
jgi:hypothetical protein